MLEHETRRQAEGEQLELDHLDDSQLVGARVANLADGQLGANSHVATICISVDERKSASPIGEATTQADAADAPSDDFMNSVLGNQIHKVASLATHANGFAKTVLQNQVGKAALADKNQVARHATGASSKSVLENQNGKAAALARHAADTRRGL